MASEITNNENGEMSKEERKVYDRQIRLWGYDGQNKYVLGTYVVIKFFLCIFLTLSRLRGMKVLLIGLQGLGAEIAKNLILSGVNSITLKDHTEVSILDCCSQFLIPRDSQERNVSIYYI